MTKEEILERSRSENRGKDIVEEEFIRKGFLVCWIVSLVLAAMVAMVEGVVLGITNYGIFFSLMSGLFSFFLMKYIRLRKRHELFITIMYGVAAICFLICWILNLANG
ncbi:MAG: hypothetical protein IJ863_04680 [Spirochaetales bacterium]|nr:hypothetical protein [Spirochaetales bacterium]